MCPVDYETRVTVGIYHVYIICDHIGIYNVCIWITIGCAGAEKTLIKLHGVIWPLRRGTYHRYHLPMYNNIIMCATFFAGFSLARRQSPGRLIQCARATLITMLRGRIGCQVVVTAAAVYNRRPLYIYIYLYTCDTAADWLPQIPRPVVCTREYIYELRTIVSLQPRTTLAKSLAKQKRRRMDGRTD
jgi:hypothetical protein